MDDAWSEPWYEFYSGRPDLVDRFRRALDPERRLLAAALAVLEPAGKVLADLAPGDGQTALAAVQAGARRVYAVTPDLDLLRQGQAATAATPAVWWLHTLGRRIPLPDRVLDGLYSLFGVTENFAIRISEVDRVLKPGGISVFVEPHHTDEYHRLRSPAVREAARQQHLQWLDRDYHVAIVPSWFQFADAAEAAAVLGFLFGPAAAARLRRRGSGRVELKAAVYQKQHGGAPGAG